MNLHFLKQSSYTMKNPKEVIVTNMYLDLQKVWQHYQ